MEFEYKILYLHYFRLGWKEALRGGPPWVITAVGGMLNLARELEASSKLSPIYIIVTTIIHPSALLSPSCVDIFGTLINLAILS